MKGALAWPPTARPTACGRRMPPLVEVFGWASTEAIARAHETPELHQIRAASGQACTHVKVSPLAEAQNLFAEITPVR